MPAYFLVDLREVKDAAKLAEYRSRIRPVVERFGGRYLAAGGQCDVREGSYQPVFLVMIEFPTIEDGRRWYDSKEYRELKEMRLAASVSNGFFFAGLE